MNVKDYNEIAQNIVDVVLSPDSKIGLIQGVLSVPLDFGYFLYGYFDTDNYYAHQTERIRIVSAIKKGILNYEHILGAINTIFSYFNKFVPESIQEKIYQRTVSPVAGRVGANYTVAAIIATAITERACLIATLRGGSIGNLLLISGMTERCIRTSEKLKAETPEIYGVLRKNDYDLLYFLFEPALQPFVDALYIRNNSGTSTFNKILILIEEKMNA